MTIVPCISILALLEIYNLLILTALSLEACSWSLELTYLKFIIYFMLEVTLALLSLQNDNNYNNWTKVSSSSHNRLFLKIYRKWKYFSSGDIRNNNFKNINASGKISKLYPFQFKIYLRNISLHNDFRIWNFNFNISFFHSSPKYVAHLSSTFQRQWKTSPFSHN